MSSSDFTTIRAQIINYLQNQQQFSSYNFSGSSMSVWVDLLSYNTSLAAANINMSFNESFIDTANQRANVVSSSKEIGYIPQSCIAATAQVTVSFAVTGNPSQYILPQGTRFVANISGNSYTFVTTQDNTFNNVSNVFTGTIEIVQGVLTNFQYTVNTDLPQQRLTIPSLSVDLNYLTVSWQSSISDLTATLVPSADSIGFGNIGPDALVYFIQNMYDGYYDISCGDGVYGEAFQNGNVITLNYLITDPQGSANGALSFTLASTLSNVTSLSVTTIDAAAGGSLEEDIESIRFLAPLSYQAQERAVTEVDYVSLLKNNLGNILDVNVYGGEKTNPPYYGKVFISIVPSNEGFLTNSQKNNIVNLFLQNYNIVGVRPTIVNPNYLYVNVNTTVRYSARQASVNSNIDIAASVTTAITNFFNSQVNKFGANLYYSKLLATIDNVSPLILTNVTDFILQRQVEILPSVSNAYNFTFNNAIEPNSVSSNQITIAGNNYYMKDIPQGNSPFTTGNIAIYNTTGNTTNYLNTNVGTVDYTTGVINIPNLKIDNITNDPINQLLIVSVGQGDVQSTANPTDLVLDLNVYANGLEDVITLGTVTVNLVEDNS